MPLRRLLLALVVTTSLVPAGPSALAASVEPLPPPAAHAVVPGSEPGAFRTWVQLVWNPHTRTLDRLTLTAWDPVPSLGLELTWQPDDPAAYAPGPISGKGTLSFRKPGAASYDATATLAQYRGTLDAGRPEGFGEYLDDTGFSYAGGWHDGLMDGAGRLMLANGDEFVGTFRAGLRDGDGTFTNASGQVYTGRFTAGLPDPEKLLAAEGSEIKIGVVAERRPHNYELNLDPLSYTAKSNGDALYIFPDDPRLLDVWHGTTRIDLTDAEVTAYDDPSTTPSFLGAHERFDPLSLVFSLENGTTDTVSVVGGYLDIATSASDPEPAMQVRPTPRDPCSGQIEFIPQFFIDNFGWTSADNATLHVGPGSADGRPEGTDLTVPLGNITDTKVADVTEPLKALGLDTDYVSTTKLHCTDSNDERLCLAELKQSGKFGKLADFLSLDYATVTIALAGTLDYDWTGAGGTINHKSSPFQITVPIASVASDAECGEGGEIIPVRHDPFMLHLDDKNYRIAIPFAGDVTPGFTSRWRIELEAPQTSLHDFKIVLLTADGDQLTSRPLHLTYFMPPGRGEPAAPQ